MKVILIVFLFNLIGFMYYQQPMAYRTAERTMYGVHYQNQQFRNQRVAAFPRGAQLNGKILQYLSLLKHYLTNWN